MKAKEAMTLRAPFVWFLPFLAASCGAPATGTHADIAPITVSTADVRSVDVPATFEAGGLVRARATASIASRILAPVVEVHVRAGDRVQRGAQLVTLEGREITASHERAVAVLAGSGQAASAADGAVRSAEATLALARVTYDRLRTLHEKRSASTQELDQARAAFEAADGHLQVARANSAAAVATEQAARAALDAASAAASYITLTAPFDGIVADRHVDPGDMANPGTPLLTLEDPAAFRLEVMLDEARASGVAAGSSAEVEIDAASGSGRWVKTSVSEIARIDPAAHSFLIKIDLPSEVAVRSGAFGRARFTGSPRRMLAVPEPAVVRRGQLAFVFLAGPNGRARLQPISTGTVVNDMVEVLSGLTEGARVVLDAAASLSHDAPVAEGRP